MEHDLMRSRIDTDDRGYKKVIVGVRTAPDGWHKAMRGLAILGASLAAFAAIFAFLAFRQVVALTHQYATDQNRLEIMRQNPELFPKKDGG